MPRRLAATLSLIVFALCLAIGWQAGNPFGTTVMRALGAMAGTFVIGLVIGVMADVMLKESVAAAGSAVEAEKLKNSEGISPPADR